MDDKATVVFLIPFASRRVKSNWGMACAQLRQTLKSVQNSTDGNYRVVVAGHETPDFDVGFDSRFHFLSLNHPLPVHKHRGVAGRLDKMTKYAAAWNYAKTTWNPKYLMKLDADDFISSKLVDWLGHAGGEAGYLIKHGWFWKSGARFFIQRTELFDRECGSCLIIRSDLADKTGPFLTEMEGFQLSKANREFAKKDQCSLVPGSGTSTLLLNEGHQRYEAQFRYLGHQLITVPFHAAVYRTGNPVSLSQTGLRIQFHSFRWLLGRIRRTRLVTSALRREFMLD